MTLHICTAGTSIALNAGQRKLHPIEDEEAFRKALSLGIAEFRRDHPDDFLVRLSAETNGLSKAGVARGDEVVLLTSDTPAGRLCGEALVEVMGGAFERVRARAVAVPGLQVADAELFRRRAIPGLFEILDDLTRDLPSDEVRLNASGGFKGTVPFAVLYAMFNDLDVDYVYEQSPEQITLPAFPVEFDWERYAPAAEAVLSVERATSLPAHEVQALLPSDREADRRAFAALFEEVGGELTLSPVGLLLVTRLKRLAEATPIRLSPGVARTLGEATGRSAEIMNQMLGRLRNPLMRQLPHHADRLHSTDLRVWKRYTAGGPRMLYWIGTDAVYVAEFFLEHEAYDHFWKQSPKRIAEYDTAGFVDYLPPETEPETDYLEELGEIRLGAEEEAAELRRELEALRIGEQQLRVERNRLKKERHEATEQARQRAREKADREWQHRMSRIQRRHAREVKRVTAEKRRVEDRLRDLEAWLVEGDPDAPDAPDTEGDAGPV